MGNYCFAQVFFSLIDTEKNNNWGSLIKHLNQATRWRPEHSSKLWLDLSYANLHTAATNKMMLTQMIWSKTGHPPTTHPPGHVGSCVRYPVANPSVNYSAKGHNIIFDLCNRHTAGWKIIVEVFMCRYLIHHNPYICYWLIFHKQHWFRKHLRAPPNERKYLDI